MSWKRTRQVTLLLVYCIFLLLLFDFGYGLIFPNHRIPDPVYHHGLRPSMFAEDRWGGEAYDFHINELGFKDDKLESGLGEFETNVLIIGDSFTEGSGVAPEKTFAGLLAAQGRQGEPPIGVYNAGLSSYSPTIYYLKTKHLFENVQRFDHVVVFLDLVDIWDESHKFLCFDDDPQYEQHCDFSPLGWRARSFFIKHFPKTREIYDDLVKRLRLLLTDHNDERMDNARSEQYFRYEAPRSAWTIDSLPLHDAYEPLGVERAIARARQNMEKLHAFLAQQGASLNVVVYPWPMQLQFDDRDSRQVEIWSAFCEGRCRNFVDLFPRFFAVKDELGEEGWYPELFIAGDVHFNEKGHALVAAAVKDMIDGLRH